MTKEKETEEIKIMIDNKIVQKYVKEEYDKGFLAGQNSQKEKDLEILDYKNEGYCSRCGYPQEAHTNRGNNYDAKQDKKGVYHWKPCKKFQEELTSKIKGDKK